MYFQYWECCEAVKLHCPPIDQPGKWASIHGILVYLAWHTRFGVYIKRGGDPNEC